MKICVLSSGSKGNCTYVETSSHKYLFDLGRNYNYIEEKLSEIGTNPKDIDYIVISHSHSDHISGIESFIKKHKPIICVTREILKHIPCIKYYDNLYIYDEDSIKLDEDEIFSFNVSHDSNDAKNFIISSNNLKVAYVTDTGYLNQKYFKMLSNLDCYLFESNHDVEMLNNGPYPKWLKKRVISDIGHLSNISSSVYLSKLIGNNTKKIILTHLSETNNTPEKALETFNNVTSEYEINFSNISCAKQNEISEVINI